MNVKKYVPLMLKASFIDGLWVTGFYLITYVIFKNQNPFTNPHQLLLFAIISIGWAYFWEIYSIKHKRWEYTKTMPCIAGAGITPLLQLLITGVLALSLMFYQ